MNGDVYVDGNTECPCDGSYNNPYKYIKDSIRNNNNNDKIIVRNGTYSGELNINISIFNTNTVLQSVNGPENTIIDCENNGYGFNIISNSIIIQGFTVKNCQAIPRDNTIKYSGTQLGGAFFIQSTSTTLYDMIIEQNEAQYGGGFYIYSNSIFIYNSIIRNNKASDKGAGLYIESAYVRLGNTILHDNNCEIYGGGAYIYSAELDLQGSSKVYNNIAGNSGNQIYCNNSRIIADSNDNIPDTNGPVSCIDCHINVLNNSDNSMCYNPTQEPQTINNGNGYKFGMFLLIIFPICIIIFIVCYFCRYQHNNNISYKPLL